MTAGYSNAIYGVADYLALPIGMLLAAPFLLRHLGAAQYGVWICIASAAVSGGGIVSGSFGDAAIKYVGECRSREDWSGIARIVQNMMSINLALSGMLALILWCLTAYLAHHIAKGDPGLKAICIMSLRIGSGLLLVKSIESVFISTLRAFESYGSTVRIAISSRSAVLASCNSAGEISGAQCCVDYARHTCSFCRRHGGAGDLLFRTGSAIFTDPFVASEDCIRYRDLRSLQLAAGDLQYCVQPG